MVFLPPTLTHGVECQTFIVYLNEVANRYLTFFHKKKCTKNLKNMKISDIYNINNLLRLEYVSKLKKLTKYL